MNLKPRLNQLHCILCAQLSPYSFNLNYIKGKDILLADYLSRHHVHDNHITDLIPISFCWFSLFLHHKGFDTYHSTMRSQAKAAGEVALKVHGIDKTLDPNVKLKHQSKNVLQTSPPPASKRSNVQSLAKKLISKSIQ